MQFSPAVHVKKWLLSNIVLAEVSAVHNNRMVARQPYHSQRVSFHELHHNCVPVEVHWSWHGESSLV